MYFDYYILTGPLQKWRISLNYEYFSVEKTTGLEVNLHYCNTSENLTLQQPYKY